MQPSRASKLNVASDVLSAFSATPLDDLVALRRFHFQIGVIPEKGIGSIHLSTARAAVRSKLGMRKDANEDIDFAIRGRFGVPNGLVSNICHALVMMGRFGDSIKLIKEVIDNESDADGYVSAMTVFYVSISTGRFDLLYDAHRKYKDFVSPLISAVNNLSSNELALRCFSYRQKLISEKVSEDLCDLQVCCGNDSEGNWRLRTEYWMYKDYGECDEITQSVWSEMDIYYEQLGLSHDPLATLAPFLIKELPAFSAITGGGA